MRRFLLFVAGLTALVVAALPAAPAGADVPAFQDARNRQVKKFNLTYSRVCPSCQEGEQPRNEIPKRATGTAKFIVSSYKILDQNRKYDFFLVDATASLVDRTGDEDWGWMDVTLRSVGDTKILGNSYTLGKGVENVTTCKTFPVNLGVSFYGVSAGTTAGHVSFCNQGSKLSSSSISSGRRYHATGLSGIASIQMQRYVQVRNGALPHFRVVARTNDDSLQCPTLSDGTHCFIGRAMHSAGRKIGTSPQR